jgi:imidazolonepropionase-like amidohydrolase
MKRTLAWLLTILLSASTVAQTKSAPQVQPLVFIHVTVIDVTGRDTHHALKTDHTVLISGNRITTVGKHVRVPTGAQIIDGTGKFLIPGLWDMHVHALHKERWGTFSPLFIANGVTGIRDMGTMTPLEQINQIRREIADGTRLGPRIVAAGPIVDGPKPVNPTISIGVANEVEARRAVRLLKQQGADFIKVYSTLPREAYFAIIDEAKKQGLAFAGHVPLSVTAAEASNAGQKSMEHLLGVLEGCALNEIELRQEAIQKITTSGLMSSQANSMDSFSSKKAAKLFSLLAKNQTWQVPTVTFWHSVTYYDQSNVAYANDPRLKYIFLNLRERWKPENPQSSPYANFVEDYAKLKRLFPEELKIIGEMHRAGVQFLAGTDTAVPYAFPGFSLHDELAFLVQAGLTPLEALQTATLNPAIFLGREKELGTIEKGKLADLVLLDANPLENISNTKRINAVVLNGRLLDRKTLDKMLADVEMEANKK